MRFLNVKILKINIVRDELLERLKIEKNKNKIESLQKLIEVINLISKILIAFFICSSVALGKRFFYS